MSYFTIFVSQPSHDSSNAFKEPQDLAAASNRCISTHKYRTGASTNWILDNHQMKFDYNRNCNKYTDGPLNEKPISNSKLDDNESGKTNKQKRLIIKPYANNKHHQNTYASVLKFPKMLFVPSENATRYGKLWDNNKGRTPHSRVPWNNQVSL